MTERAIATEPEAGPRSTRWVRESGFLLWFAALAGIGAWMVHLTLVSAITEFTAPSRRPNGWSTRARC